MNSKFDELNRKANEAVMQFQNVCIKRDAWQTCLNCMYWTPVRTITPCAISKDGHAESNSFTCSKFEQMPPPHIIVTGCPDHENDIPF